VLQIIFFHCLLSYLPFSVDDAMGFRQQMHSRLLNSDTLEIHLESLYLGEGEKALPKGNYSLELFVMISPKAVIPVSSLNLGKLDSEYELPSDLVLKISGRDINRALMLAAVKGPGIPYVVVALKRLEEKDSKYVLFLDLLNRTAQNEEESSAAPPSDKDSPVLSVTRVVVPGAVEDETSSEQALRREFLNFKNYIAKFGHGSVQYSVAQSEFFSTASGFSDDDLIVIEPVTLARENSSAWKRPNNYELQMELVSYSQGHEVSRTQLGLLPLGTVAPVETKSVSDRTFVVDGASINHALIPLAAYENFLSFKLVRKNKIWSDTVIEKEEFNLGSTQAINLPRYSKPLISYGTEVLDWNMTEAHFIFAYSRIPGSKEKSNSKILSDAAITRALTERLVY